jgi:class 3 adenylate cyclase
VTLPAGTVTLLFTDVESSTALLRRLGDEWPDVLERHRTILRRAVTDAGGVVVDCQGDALFAAFRSARSGVAAAVSGQRALAAEPWPNDEQLRVRMALHTGEPHPTADGGYTGIDVVRGARLCCAGHGGQVLLTEVVRLLAGVAARDLGPVRLRDIDEPEHVHQLVADGLAEGFPTLREQAAQAAEHWSGEEPDLDTRIRQASEDLERRITEGVAASVEQTLAAIRAPRKPVD